ncbi:hypothetical protein FRC03_006721 [Tulasnella sp. 419]|nr:hypothetical protein FRC03_006721 [Tulasnella sp. 419]
MSSQDPHDPHTQIESLDPNSISSNRKTITILYFASAFTCTSKHRETLVLPTSPTPFSLPMLSRLLADTYIGMKEILESSAWSVNEEMVPEDEVDKVILRGDEVVAVIPPVSGG